MSVIIENKTLKAKLINLLLVILLVIVLGISGVATKLNGIIYFIAFRLLLKWRVDIAKRFKYATLSREFPNLFFIYPVQRRSKVVLEFYSREYYVNFKFVNKRNRNLSFKLQDDLNPRLLHPKQYEQMVQLVKN